MNSDWLPSTSFLATWTFRVPAGSTSNRGVTFRNHTVAAMFCIACEHAWTESTTHPELRHLSLDRQRLSDLALPPSA